MVLPDIKMKIKIKSILLLLLPVFLFTQINCSRENPEEINNDPVIQSLKPLEVFSLDIPEPSGIAYNTKNNSLMIVSDAKQEIFETDFSGKILATVLTSSSDLEGISLSKNCDTIYVVEEKTQLVRSYTETGVNLSSFQVNVATNPKHALEGVSVDYQSGSLIVLNEKFPCMLLEFKNSVETRRMEINYTTDISDVLYESSNRIWIVSDESQKIFIINSSGTLISQWTIPVMQAEGIAIKGDKIYIVSDVEGKLYVFQKPV